MATLDNMEHLRTQPTVALSSGTATIGSSVRIVGEIFSKEDLYIDGDFEGAIDVPGNRLTVGPNGVVHAVIRAREVVLLGTVRGNIEALDRIEIRANAKLAGDMRTARIIIEDGAYFKGSIDIVKKSAYLTVFGSPEAEIADARAEHEIKEHRYTTFQGSGNLSDALTRALGTEDTPDVPQHGDQRESVPAAGVRW